jgi:crotonobetainyl-CoA:carnitine CoA-transferase CaiB-like acyl-CoA transferase
MQPPLRFSDMEARDARPAPLLGEHTAQVKAELETAGLLRKRDPS